MKYIYKEQTHPLRPYESRLLVTVLRSAPGHIYRQASGHLRLMRFRDTP